ncbi:hypothetical protein [Calothrix sp. NIES-3974]|uniref:hypothetical protein n=1 Tax=Calothrix sp. NIES-3974 TaxID=2005462 RepID=UPI000B5E1C57|nr:hypothetical protein [Calothrix sp. NIES-3974]BAZ07451.1 hypothetical protein NIES3974_41140 [Calothrix sp. NIES-3974]
MSNAKEKNNPDIDTQASGGYQTPVEESVRQTGAAVKGDGKSSAQPEAPENDSVQGSPNQGTESR